MELGKLTILDLDGDGYPDADLSTAWIEPGDGLIYCVPLRDEPNGAPTGMVEYHLHYDGTALTHGGPAVVTTQGGGGLF